MNEQTENTPSPTADIPLDQLRLDLLARAKMLFGAAEVVQLVDGRFPAVFQDSVKQLNITVPNDLVAVSCGSASNLCAIAISFNDPDLAKTMLNLNPWLYKTVWTTWHRIMFFWLRLDGWRPGNSTMHRALWINEGLLPAVDVADSTHYPDGFPVTGRGSSPVLTKFEDIKWPQHHFERFLLERLEGQYGGLFQIGPRGREIFSHQTAAHFFAATLGLKYTRQTESFTYCREAGKPMPIEKSNLCEIISDWLHQQAEKAGVKFPAGDPVPDIVNALKQICISVRTDEADGLHIYLRERLEQKAGVSLTTVEIFTDYLAFCEKCGAARYPERAFYKKLSVAILERFGVCKAHDIQRPKPNGGSTSKYGFHNLAIKSNSLEAAEVSEPSEVI